VAFSVCAGVAAARNFHCAGGIQYVIQGTKEKDKGNLEDAHRIFGKAVAQLTTCVKEDPNDNESWSYLGWAYAELDSAEQAGAAFDEAIKRLAGDPKALERAKQNRHAYWVQYYNAGLTKYKEADQIFPVGDLLNSKDSKVDAAKAKLAESEVFFRKAVVLSPGEEDCKASNNLAVVLTLQGKFDESGAVAENGLKLCPNNEELKKRLEILKMNRVTGQLKSGDYETALATMDQQLARDPSDYNLLVRAAQTAFEQGDKLDEKKDPAAKAVYARAQGYYGRAAAAAPDAQNKKDMTYNQAIAAQKAGADAESAKLVFALVQDNPKDKALHGLLRSAFDRIGNKKKADDEVWVILGLNDNATAVADIPGYLTKVAKTSDAGKTLAANGPPEEVKQFKSGDTQIDIWYYWPKKLTYAFAGGRQVGTANFGDFGVPPAVTLPKVPAKAPGAAGTKG
jgi:tetratricopeptide (TPR) repeat protein